MGSEMCIRDREKDVPTQLLCYTLTHRGVFICVFDVEKFQVFVRGLHTVCGPGYASVPSLLQNCDTMG